MHRTRLTVQKLGDIVAVYLTAPDGISAKSLATKSSLAILTAQRLIKRFHAAMAVEDISPALVDVFPLDPSPKSKENDSTLIAARLEMIGAQKGSISLRQADLNELDMLHRLQPTSMKDLEGSVEFAFVPDLIAYCKRVLCVTYRGAVKPENLQAYLNEIAFRWNNRNDLPAGISDLLRRLLKPDNYPPAAG